LRLSSFGGYGLALAALALVVFGAYDSYPHALHSLRRKVSGQHCAVCETYPHLRQGFGEVDAVVVVKHSCPEE